MKLKNLIQKINGHTVIHINRKQYIEELPKEMLELEITKVDIETKNEAGNSLEELGYSFEVGV